MTSKAVFKNLYGILLAIIFVFADYTIKYVQDEIGEYESHEPVHAVEQYVDELRGKISAGTEINDFTYPEIPFNEFEEQADISKIYSSYEEKLRNAKDFEIKLVSGSYSITNQIYAVYADGETVLKIDLKSVDSKTLLGMLTVNTWEVDKVYPVITLDTYEVNIEIPDEFEIAINEKKVEDKYIVEAESTEDTKFYCIMGFFDEPKVQIYDKYGMKCDLTEDKGIITPEYTEFNLILPGSPALYASAEMTGNDNIVKVKGTAQDTGTLYTLKSACDYAYVCDSFGNKIKYQNGDDLKIYNVSFVVPDNFTVSYKDNDLKECITEINENDEYSEYIEFAEMPKLLTYEMNGVLEVPEITLTDNLGKKVNYEFTNNYFEITKQSAIHEVPEEVLTEANPITAAKTWSLFNSNDLTGSKHGLSTIKQYLVPDTYLYQMAVKYANGIDITFASRHDSTEFVDEVISDYIKYSDDLFSVQIYLNKKMYVTTDSYTGDVYDETKGTFYFYRYDGIWRILGFGDTLE